MFLKILFILIIFINFLLGFFVFGQNTKATSNRLFFLLSLLAAVWTFTDYMSGIRSSLFWFNSSYAFGSLVLATGFIWILKICWIKVSQFRVILISIASLFFFVCCFIPGFMSKSYDQAYSNVFVPSVPGYGAIFYLSYYILISSLILWNVFNRYQTTSDAKEKTQLGFVLLGASIALLASLISTIFPLIFHLSIWGIDVVGFLFFLIFIAYSITRHNLFNIKIIAIEILSTFLWLVILIRIFLAPTAREASIEGIFLFVTIVLGITLIKTALHEQRQSAYIDKLTKDLTEAYGELKAVDAHLVKAEKDLGINQA